MRLGPELAGMRLDRALVEALERLGIACTRSRLARAFEAGGVCLAGHPVKPGRTVEARADAPWVVEVVLPRPEPLRAEPEDVPLRVLHEDDLVLVVDKPADMAVHVGAGPRQRTLVGAVLHHLGVSASALPVLPGNDATRPGIVHRLDKDTSGVMVVTKTMAAQAHLAAQFQAHSIDRRYVGLVLGVPRWETLRIETLHGRDPIDRRRFSPTVPRGRRAVTHARVRERLPCATWVAFELETGRTHQIRMHARHVGHPIFGDALYGRPPRDSSVRGVWTSLGRHVLHAEWLGFEHPDGRGRVGFAAPLPPELERLGQALARSGGGEL